MSTTLIMVRHGETVWHGEHRYAGSSDIALTDHGMQQAEELAAWAAKHRPDVLVSSELTRAWRTADAVAQATGLEHWTEPDLREVDFGKGEGLTLDELYEKYPDTAAAFVAAPARSPMPSGEPGAIAVARALKVLARIIRDADGGTALVVGHGTLMRLVICTLISIDPNLYRDVFPEVDNCALTTLSFEDDKASLLNFNVPVGNAR
ncbi:histidine phosphatase family protein [Microbacterium sp. MPKO10]|uniref:histidine phosphatase family protein n=1 Tax=Microbacterium sp. MPKO10 TaxID=2989818 RepID=UPI0022365AF9|nr:histidine phosphatase family protein [Microbacterium sp. MPKO10]MCW4456815.1 histidine phosphatase family protein [Microbacterium sp. MPKO10]